VLRELEQRRAATGEPDEAGRIEKQLAVLAEREKRLVRLYTYGEIDESLFGKEFSDLKRQRTALKQRLADAEPSAPILPRDLTENELAQACAAVGEWLDQADESERGLALEALQISVEAIPGQATVRGVLPSEPPFHCHSNSHPDAYCPVNEKRALGVPFQVIVALA
jgi:hypothetical protein